MMASRDRQSIDPRLLEFMIGAAMSAEQSGQNWTDGPKRRLLRRYVRILEKCHPGAVIEKTAAIPGFDDLTTFRLTETGRVALSWYTSAETAATAVREFDPLVQDRLVNLAKSWELSLGETLLQYQGPLSLRGTGPDCLPRRLYFEQL